MNPGDGRLAHAMEPLSAVDVKTLSLIADDLKKSRDKRKRAVGVFLDRINRYRAGDLPPTGSSGSSPRTAQSKPDSSSGLRDLRE